MAFYLDFENKIKNLQEEIELAKIRKDEHAQKVFEADMEKIVKKNPLRLFSKNTSHSTAWALMPSKWLH